MMFTISGICKISKQKYESQVSKMEDTLKIRHFPEWNLHRFTAKCFIKIFNEKSKYFTKIIKKSLIHDVTLSY